MGEKKELKVDVPGDVRAGRYANNMRVAHTRSEFLLDFLFVTPEGGVVVSRVVTNPGHAKRILIALSDNLEKYETAFGQIVEDEGQPATFH